MYFHKMLSKNNNHSITINTAIRTDKEEKKNKTKKQRSMNTNGTIMNYTRNVCRWSQKERRTTAGKVVDD